VLELSDGAEDVEEHLADRRAGVDALVQDFEGDASFAEQVGEVHEVAQGATEAVQFGDDEVVTLTQDDERLVEFGP
jgi:hypothetical protein